MFNKLIDFIKKEKNWVLAPVIVIVVLVFLLIIIANLDQKLLPFVYATF